MSKADEYDQHAADCISLAERMDNPADRARLLEMAQSWRRLAQQERDRAAGRQ